MSGSWAKDHRERLAALKEHGPPGKGVIESHGHEDGERRKERMRMNCIEIRIQWSTSRERHHGKRKGNISLAVWSGTPVTNCGKER